MAFGHAIAERIAKLRSRRADIPEILIRNQTKAIEKAVEVATAETPPNERTPQRGTGTITGETKSAWATDSQTNPEVSGNNYKVILANNKQWVSYLNDGHRMDKHFVPGLMVNPYSGLLERVDPEMGGIMVGTKTQYVPGLYMKETALSNYRGTLERGIDQEIKELFAE